MSYSFEKITYKEIKEYAGLIEDLYKKKRITIPQNSELAQHINSAKILSDSWDVGDDSVLNDREEFFKLMNGSLQILRLGSSLKYLVEKPKLKNLLKRLLIGSIDPTNRKGKPAKDICFEILVASRLEIAGFQTHLTEPDILFGIAGFELAIACKHPHPQSSMSLNVNLGQHFNKATEQIKKSGKRGLIAISLDSMVAHRELAIVKNSEELNQKMGLSCSSFIFQNEVNFRKWINSDEVLGVIACLSTLTIIDDIKLPTEAQFWALEFACSENDPYNIVYPPLLNAFNGANHG